MFWFTECISLMMLFDRLVHMVDFSFPSSDQDSDCLRTKCRQLQSSHQLYLHFRGTQPLLLGYTRVGGFLHSDKFSDTSFHQDYPTSLSLPSEIWRQITCCLLHTLKVGQWGRRSKLKGPSICLSSSFTSLVVAGSLERLDVLSRSALHTLPKICTASYYYSPQIFSPRRLQILRSLTYVNLPCSPKESSRP